MKKHSLITYFIALAAFLFSNSAIAVDEYQFQQSVDNVVSVIQKAISDDDDTENLTAQQQCERDKQDDSRLYWDTRNNKCMLKLYENTTINMKDIGVAYTDGSSTENKASQNNSQMLSGGTGMVAGSISNTQVTETLYFLEHGNRYPEGETRPSLGSKIHQDTIVSYRKSYEPIVCPSHHTRVWYVAITKRSISTMARELEKLKKRDDVFTSVDDALTRSIMKSNGIPYYQQAEAMASLRGKVCGGGASPR